MKSIPKKFALYLNGFNALSLGGAAVLRELQVRGAMPERIYACGIGALFANDYAALDGKFEDRVLHRFARLSKSFRFSINTGDTLFSKFASTYKLATTVVTSKKVKSIVKEKLMITRLENTSKPKMDVKYSAVNIYNASEVLISSREWKIGLRASMSVVPIFVPADYRGQKLVSTTVITGVPGFSTLENEKLTKVFVNTMPCAKKKLPERTWEIMLRADYARTTALINSFSKKFDAVLDFSEHEGDILDFSSDSWTYAKKIAHKKINDTFDMML